MDKTYASAAEAVADIGDGASIAVGGFGLCGNPMELIRALHDLGSADLVIASNNCGVDDWGLGILLADRRIAMMQSSYVGENKEFARQFLSGELEVELMPQGTLAERLRAGGCGIPAFFTPAGGGTDISDGGLPLRYNSDGSIAKASEPKETRVFPTPAGDKTYVLEHAIAPDFALVHALRGDTHGNLVFDRSARNFNPLCAMAGRITIAQVEELVEPGGIEPDAVHLPGVYVDRIVEVGTGIEKRIERRTVQPKADFEAQRKQMEG